MLKFYIFSFIVIIGCSKESTIDSGYIQIATELQTVSITFAPDIIQTNESIYYVTGECTKEEESISVSIASINTTASCTDGIWATPALDISSLADSVSIEIKAKNEKIIVSKITSNPVVSLNLLPAIDSTNISSYAISGSCSESGEEVAISVGSLNFSPTCSGTIWSTGDQNMSSLSDGIISITANHSALGGTPEATPASTTVSKDLSIPTVTISSAPNISSVNQLNFQLSGTCSENSRAINLAIDTVLVSATCSNGSWLSAGVDVSAIPDGASISVTADHSDSGGEDSNQVSLTISKNTSTPSVINLTVASTLSSSASLAWDLVGAGGFSVEDYRISYRVSESPTWVQFSDSVSATKSVSVTGLLPSTAYQFRVAVIYDGDVSAWSSFVSGVTQPDSALFEPYSVMNVGGATATAVVAYYDNTTLTLPDNTTTVINRGAPYSLSSSSFDTLKADKPFFAAGRNGNANVVWNPVEWAGRSFSFSAFRNNPQRLFVYAVENAYVEVRRGVTVLASGTVAASGNTTLTWSTLGSYQVVSSGTILAYHMSNGQIDPKPLLPSANEIIGIPSTRMILTTTADGTNYSYIHSDSTSVTSSLNKVSEPLITARGISSLFQSESLLISADQKISGASYADSNGSCAAPFLPTNLMRTKYMINVNSDYVAFAGKESGTIRVFDDNGIERFPSLILTRSGGGPNAPFRARRASTNAGWYFLSDVPVAGWYQPRVNVNAVADDETILFGTND